MKKIVILMIIMIFTAQISNAYAYTDYGTLQSQHSALEMQYKSWSRDLKAIDAYLDAAQSGNMEEWDRARKDLPTTVYFRILHAEDEIEKVKQERETYSYMASEYYYEMTMNEVKQEVYYKTFIQKDETSLQIAEKNGLPICPSGVDNYWFLVARTSLESDIAAIDNDRMAYISLTYLLTGKIINVEKSTYLLDCDGRLVNVIIPNEEGVTYSMPAVGERVNVFGTYFSGSSEDMYFIAYGLEENIDFWRVVRLKYLLGAVE